METLSAPFLCENRKRKNFSLSHDHSDPGLPFFFYNRNEISFNFTTVYQDLPNALLDMCRILDADIIKVIPKKPRYLEVSETEGMQGSMRRPP